MFKKIFWVVLIVIAVVVVEILLTAEMPAIRSIIDIAAADPSAGNYAGYSEALGAAPIWVYFIPILVGGIGVIMILRAPEQR